MGITKKPLKKHPVTNQSVYWNVTNVRVLLNVAAGCRVPLLNWTKESDASTRWTHQLLLSVRPGALREEGFGKGDVQVQM